MLSRSYIPFQYAVNFLGVNAKDSNENMLDGEWSSETINCISDPQGAIGSRKGFTALTTASIGASASFTGLYQFNQKDESSHLLAAGTDGVVYKLDAGAYVNLNATGVTLATGANSRVSFSQLNDTCIICDGENTPYKYTGSGSIATLGGTLVTADFGIESWRYMWLHSTADPRLMYYCTTIGDPESGYTSFINFDEDPYNINGATKQGDDMIISKPFSLFRLQFTGGAGNFRKYRIPSKVGAVSHQAMREIPDGRVIFLGSDNQVYMLDGDQLVPVGDNIRPLLQSSLQSRMQYAASGMLIDRSWFWLSVSRASNATENDTVFCMDWSRPYQDKFGKVQFPWFVFTISANVLAAVTESGANLLYHGDYAGQLHKNDIGTNDNGSAFRAAYKSKLISAGDPTLTKKYTKIMFTYDNKGSHDLDISLVMDGNASTQKTIQQSMSGGVGASSLFGIAKFDEDFFSSDDDVDVGRDIDRVGKLIEVNFATDGLNEAWNIRNFTLLGKALRRGTIRSSS